MGRFREKYEHLCAGEASEEQALTALQPVHRVRVAYGVTQSLEAAAVKVLDQHEVLRTESPLGSTSAVGNETLTKVHIMAYGYVDIKLALRAQRVLLLHLSLWLTRSFFHPSRSAKATPTKCAIRFPMRCLTRAWQRTSAAGWLARLTRKATSWWWGARSRRTRSWITCRSCGMRCGRLVTRMKMMFFTRIAFS